MSAAFIVGPSNRDVPGVERILRSLPDRFGREDAFLGNPIAPEQGLCRDKGVLARQKFEPLETFPSLWGVDTPALQLVKTLPTD